MSALGDIAVVLLRRAADWNGSAADMRRSMVKLDAPKGLGDEAATGGALRQGGREADRGIQPVDARDLPNRRTWARIQSEAGVGSE
ncbi:MAG: hypothetical protein WBM40_15730 [Thiohalocapsa sp.]